MLPHGELTEIGEKGINLSGKHSLYGTQSRVRLIRHIPGGQKVGLSHVTMDTVIDSRAPSRLAFRWLAQLIRKQISFFSMTLSPRWMPTSGKPF